MKPVPLLTDDWVLAHRPARNPLAADRPYAYLVEPEPATDGRVIDVATLFLTNRECPFRCTMCDLWKNTLPESVAPGQIPEQIRWALAQLPSAQYLKLYNAGSFFDPRAIPPDDYAEIAQLAVPFERVIVECHPRLVGRRCHEFHALLADCRGSIQGLKPLAITGDPFGVQEDRCGPNGTIGNSQGFQPPVLEVAMGLETVHPDVLPRLNKQMTLDDFARAAGELRVSGIALRAFIMVRPPFLTDTEGLEWAKRSLDFAFGHGVECCGLIPTRDGNGAMEELARQGEFAPPSLDSLEAAMEYGLALRAGRVFLDLWDIGNVSPDAPDRAARVARLARMNLSQRIEPFAGATA